MREAGGGDPLNVYMYRAALYCLPCGEEVKRNLDAAGKRPAKPGSEFSYDSDDYPKGPLPEGAADTPSHCAFCDEFLETPLTPAGVAYVREAVASARLIGDDESVALAEWGPFYGDLRPPPKPGDDDEYVTVACDCRECVRLPPGERAGGGGMRRGTARALGRTIRER